MFPRRWEHDTFRRDRECTMHLPSLTTAMAVGLISLRMAQCCSGWWRLDDWLQDTQAHRASRTHTAGHLNFEMRSTYEAFHTFFLINKNWWISGTRSRIGQLLSLSTYSSMAATSQWKPVAQLDVVVSIDGQIVSSEWSHLHLCEAPMVWRPV